MPFKKGESGNPLGKPKGSINKSSKDLRDTISSFLESKFPTVLKDFEKLQPKERVKLYCDLLQYGLPKLQAVSSTIEFEKLTDEQLDEVIKRLKQSFDES